MKQKASNLIVDKDLADLLDMYIKQDSKLSKQQRFMKALQNLKQENDAQTMQVNLVGSQYADAMKDKDLLSVVDNLLRKKSKSLQVKCDVLRKLMRGGNDQEDETKKTEDVLRLLQHLNLREVLGIDKTSQQVLTTTESIGARIRYNIFESVIYNLKAALLQQYTIRMIGVARDIGDINFNGYKMQLEMSLIKIDTTNSGSEKSYFDSEGSYFDSEGSYSGSYTDNARSSQSYTENIEDYILQHLQTKTNHENIFERIINEKQADRCSATNYNRNTDTSFTQKATHTLIIKINGTIKDNISVDEQSLANALRNNIMFRKFLRDTLCDKDDDIFKYWTGVKEVETVIQTNSHKSNDLINCINLDLLAILLNKPLASITEKYPGNIRDYDSQKNDIKKRILQATTGQYNSSTLSSIYKQLTGEIFPYNIWPLNNDKPIPVTSETSQLVFDPNSDPSWEEKFDAAWSSDIKATNDFELNFAVSQHGGKKQSRALPCITHIYVNGIKRKIIYKDRKALVKYKNNVITVSEFKKLILKISKKVNKNI